MECNKYTSLEIKLKQVLNILLQEDFKASDDVYLEKMISHLSGKYDKDLSTHILQQSICSEWIKNALQKWVSYKPHPSVIAFAVKVLSLVVCEEKKFTLMKENNSMDDIIQILKQCERNPIVKLSYVQLQDTLLKHSSGIDYINKSGIWQDVVMYSRQNHTIYVVKESHQFIYKLLVIYSNSANELYDYKDILKLILEPIAQKQWKEDNNIIPIENSQLNETLSPTLNLLNYILEQSLKCNEIQNVVRYVLIEYKLEYHYWNILSVTFDEVFLKVVLKLMALVIFSKLRYGTTSEHMEITKENMVDFLAQSYNIVHILIVSKRSPLRVLQICELYHLLWSYIKKNASEKDITASYETNSRIESQMTLLQITPILLAIKSSKLDSHAFFEEFIMKLYHIAEEHTVRLHYAFRDMLKGSSAIYDIAHQAILSILSTTSLLAQDKVVIIFQALIYILKDFAPEGSVYPVPENYIASEIILRAPHLLATILTALCALIKGYKISWFETIESTSVVNFSVALLANVNLSPKLTVQALQLTQLGIEKYMPTTLALLLNHMDGSGMKGLGPMIAKKLHDTQWEVRDSVLELLQTLSTMAKCKFPAFQRHLLDSNLASLVCIIAETDAESYVRASAWKCVKIMLQINLFWSECLQHQNLQSKLVQVIMNDPEAVVRQEAISTLIQVTERSNTISADVYRTINHSAIHDLHWEVQVNALIFWKTVLQRECHNQGMIDGSFPPVTFSRETHKIVNLDEAEIRSRLQVILNSLADNGCFEVLINCLHENSELQVLQEAAAIIRTLKALLLKYKFTVANTQNKGQQMQIVNVKSEDNLNEDTMKLESNQTTESISDDVIDSIVNLDDINLLTHVYNDQMSLKLNKPDIFPSHSVSPEQFLQYLETHNADDMIQVKHNWLLKLGNDFENLLDDILCCHGEKCTNDLDCY